MIALFLVLVPGQPGVSALGWGAVAGLAGLTGLVLLYKGLSGGSMAVVAPTTAMTAAIVPLTGGLLLGERPSVAALTGAGVAVVAIFFVSMGSAINRGSLGMRPIWLAVAAGTLFGIFFLLLGHAGDGAGMWPLLAARASAIPVGFLFFKRFAAPLMLERSAWRFTILAGVLDTLANVFYLLAAHGGETSIVAPVTALYPASTVVLAVIINKERLRPIQMFGLGLAAASLVLAAS
jgi:uncharacterized membrane protein